MSKTLTAEEFLNNSHFVSSDFIETDKNTVGANMNEIFDFAEAYYKEKVEYLVGQFECSFFNRGKRFAKCDQHCGDELCEKTIKFEDIKDIFKARIESEIKKYPTEKSTGEPLEYNRCRVEALQKLLEL